MAKEIGLTHIFKGNVIVMASTGKIGGEARPVTIVDVFSREL